MSKSPYSHRVRALLCGSCKRPVEVPEAGGAITCPACHTGFEIGARREPSLVAADRPPTAITERLEKLRAQDGKPLRPPGTLPLALMSFHGQDDTKKRDAALMAWQAARVGLGSGNPGEHDEAHIYFLTLALSNYYHRTKDRERRRAVLETAVELCTTPRYRQVLYGELARHAAADGDFESADAWLVPCDPESDDLYMDTAYRFSRAYIAARKEDWSEVLDLLGRDVGEIPTADFMDHLCALYRAHALEMAGDIDSATTALADAIKRAPGTPRAFADIAAGSDIELCPQALERAYQPALRKWKVRHGVFLAVWVAALNYVGLDWLMDLGPLDLGINHWWPLPIVFVVGLVFNARLRP